MKIAIASDKFKGSMTALQVAQAIEAGFRRVLPDAEIVKVPMADGGEGTVQSLVDATAGLLREVVVTGPLGEKRTARFGVLGDGETAVIEMAAASGLALVPAVQRNPLVTTTKGTGELIKAALDAGCRRLIVGIGGSATNDGGAGMAEALGIRLLDRDGESLRPGGEALRELAAIDISGMDQRIWDTEIIVACDVNNPLTGPNGASAIYGPQKGATAEMVTMLDAALANYASVIKKDLGVAIAKLPGAGAAGGLGGGLVAFVGATLRPGVEIVLEVTDLRSKLAGVDLVVTGEGAMDYQTVFGKAPIGVARAAKERGLPVVAIVGTIGTGIEAVYAAGIDAVFSITTGPCTLDEAIKYGYELVTATAENIARLVVAANRR